MYQSHQTGRGCYYGVFGCGICKKRGTLGDSSGIIPRAFFILLF